MVAPSMSLSSLQSLLSLRSLVTYAGGGTQWSEQLPQMSWPVQGLWKQGLAWGCVEMQGWQEPWLMQPADFAG
jgi:hypothetical protein